ncbi:MAG: UDP-N-acetylmuramate:L-alanyl-gamma-D-glutamyl-meso-diaminopimelate ligase [Methylococcales bacterium]|jgi:UDP-N-acetylmuramate: L-alanyl-gamma-D-glutamyl-meso-diaminopimelate ligase|nr:UDP-N-acetylmuramate:L-alanyl-gamma-D-glutamyl-meso-diaminopimelate ligase [Methylococcales bacterium]MBT7409072.1 UDP-N-acetylmuramate:L-alanyl-gamma-D-glutamyl-meso-diaminopimelate ligase [Methylococcales bacterium]
MKIHILGICGTFMGGIALLAREMGIEVSGSDQNVYPPMSTQLENVGIQLIEGYQIESLPDDIDHFVIGNAMSRGNESVEYILNQQFSYSSGPQWLYQHILKDRWVIAASGTHGKTTTASMIAWILEYTGLKPGFLIGGIPLNFGLSARLGASPFFVVEADEYDSAFFDKRSKFVHYHPKTLVINNVEYDHADIFPDLASIERQFHHLVRIVPGNGLIIYPDTDENIKNILKMGCWTQTETTALDSNSNTNFSIQNKASDGQQCDVFYNEINVGQLNWQLTGDHNVSNALSAIAATHHANVSIEKSLEALRSFKNVKRRMELKGIKNDVRVYDDFAHHPTAIETTLKGIKNHFKTSRIIAILEPRSNTMKMGIHNQTLAESLSDADISMIFQPSDIDWDVAELFKNSAQSYFIHQSIQTIIDQVTALVKPSDVIVVMSNGGFQNIHTRLLEVL